MEKMNIIFIDDSAANKTQNHRILSYQNLRLNDGLDLEVLHPTKIHQALYSKADRSTKDHIEKADLIIIDLKLNEFEDENNEKYPLNANSIMGLLRDCAPATPIFLVSSHFSAGNFSGANYTADWFDRILTSDELNISKLICSEAADYSALRNSPATYQSLHQLLKTPDADKADIESAIPTEFKQLARSLNSNSKIGAHALHLAKWIKEILMRTPGFLYDPLYTATFLGVKKDYFCTNIANRSEFNAAASYQGVFAKSNEPKWWRTGISEFIFNLPGIESITVSDIFKIAPILLNVPEEHHSSCAVCNGKFPETVGHMEDLGADWEPVHYHCSEEDPSITPVAFFELPRFIG